MMCMTTTEMRDGFCKVRECNKKCLSNSESVNNNSSVAVSPEIEYHELCNNNNNNNAKICDSNNNKIVSLKPRRKTYVLRLV